MEGGGIGAHTHTHTDGVVRDSKLKRPQSSTIAQFTTGVLVEAQKTKEPSLVKIENEITAPFSLVGGESSVVCQTADMPRSPPSLSDQAQAHRPFDNSAPGEGGEKKMESIEINK